MSYRNAFVTGASSGIGRAIASELARRGAHVHVAARRKEALDELAREIQRAGGHCSVWELDVTDVSRTRELVRQADGDSGGIDLLIANAGVGRSVWSGKLNWSRCQHTIDVNVNGAVATLVAVMDRMVSRDQGHLVGVSSLAQYRGLPQNAVYSASKAFLSTFLEGVRVDLRGTGVRVTDVRPGFVDTPMTQGNSHPMPWMLPAEEAATIVVDGIERGDPVVAFPWQLAAVVRSASALPPVVYDRLVTRVRK